MNQLIVTAVTARPTSWKTQQLMRVMCTPAISNLQHGGTRATGPAAINHFVF